MPGSKSDGVFKCVSIRWHRSEVHYGPRSSWAAAARMAPRPFYSGPWLDKCLPRSWFAAVLSRPDFARCSKRASGGTRHLLPHLPHLHFSALAHTLSSIHRLSRPRCHESEPRRGREMRTKSRCRVRSSVACLIEFCKVLGYMRVAADGHEICL